VEPELNDTLHVVWEMGEVTPFPVLSAFVPCGWVLSLC
jgi:hypothetical protein